MLSAYIDATRLPYLKPDPRFDRAYRDIFEKVVKGSTLTMKGHAPRFSLVHSLNKRAEIVRVGGEVYLVYDQYLGQTISEITRIFFAAVDPFDARAMAYRIYAESFLTLGRNDLALFSAYLYSVTYNQSHKYKSLETPGTKLKRTQSVAVQEAYIIAHEFAHYLWDMRHATQEELNNLKAHVIADGERRADQELVIESYLNDLSYQYHGKDVPHSADISTPEEIERDNRLREKLRAEFDEMDIERLKTAELLMADEGFLEESWADWQASLACLEIFGKQLEPELLVESIHLALENLTTVLMSADYAASILGPENCHSELEDHDLQPGSQDIAVRKRILRRKLTEWAELRFEGGQQIADNILRQANEKYMRIIRDPITLDVPSRFNRRSIPRPGAVLEFCQTLRAAGFEERDVMKIIQTRPFVGEPGEE